MMSRLAGNLFGAWALWRAWRLRYTRVENLLALQDELNLLRRQRRDAMTLALLAPFEYQKGLL